MRRYLARFQKLHLIFPAAFLMATSVSGIGLAMVFFLRDQFDSSSGFIGLSAAIMWGAYLAGTLLMQPLSRRILPRYSLVISGAGASIFALLIRGAGGPWAAVIAFSGVGLSAAMFWPPIMGWLSAGAEGAPLNKRISWYNIAWSAGVITGPYLAGLLAEVDSGLVLTVGAAVFAAIAVGVTAASFLLESVRSDMHRDPPRSEASTGDQSTPLRFPSWVGVFGAYVVLGVLSVAFPLYAREYLGARESVIGGVLLLRALATTVGFMLLGRSEAWHFRRVPVIAPTAVLIALSAILWVSNSMALIAVLVPIAGFALAGNYGTSVFHGVAGSTERARRMGIHEGVLTAGVIVGSLGSGAIYQRSGMGAVFLACALLLGVVLLTQMILMRKR